MHDRSRRRPLRRRVGLQHSCRARGGGRLEDRPRRPDRPPVAGNTVAAFGGDGGPARDAGLVGNIQSLVFDWQGNLYISDWNAIRRVDADTGVITTYAGRDEEFIPTFSASDAGAPAAGATIAYTGGMAWSDGGLAFVDADAGVVRRVDGQGVLRDVIRARSGLKRPYAMSIDGADRLFLSEWAHGRIRRLDPDGSLATAVNLPDNGGTTLTGPALSARSGPSNGVAFDERGDLYFSRHRELAHPAGAGHDRSGGRQIRDDSPDPRDRAPRRTVRTARRDRRSPRRARRQGLLHRDRQRVGDPARPPLGSAPHRGRRRWLVRRARRHRAGPARWPALRRRLRRRPDRRRRHRHGASRRWPTSRTSTSRNVHMAMSGSLLFASNDWAGSQVLVIDTAARQPVADIYAGAEQLVHAWNQSGDGGPAAGGELLGEAAGHRRRQRRQAPDRRARDRTGASRRDERPAAGRLPERDPAELRACSSMSPSRATPSSMPGSCRVECERGRDRDPRPARARCRSRRPGRPRRPGARARPGGRGRCGSARGRDRGAPGGVAGCSGMRTG